MITLIAIQQEMVWKHTIKQCLHYDFYHTWDYHRMADEGVPFLLKFSYGEDFIVLPLLKRSIPNSKWYDLTCVNGYSGPLSNKNFKDISNQMIIAFKRELSAFLRDNHILTLFCRLNPFLNQLSFVNGLDNVCIDEKMVVIDLRRSFEEQLSGYQKHHFKKILKIRDQGFYVKESKSPGAIKEFAAIYHENLKRVAISTFKKLDETYLENFFHAKDFESRLFLVYHGTIPVCGEVVTLTNKIMQAHILATKPAYRKFAPAKLLTHEISLRGRELGMHYFNLGGGVSFRHDAEFRWKSAFSGFEVNDCSWRHIADQKAYNKLIQQADIPPGTEPDFFPLYRYKSVISDPGSRRPQPARMNDLAQHHDRHEDALLAERV